MAVAAGTRTLRITSVFGVCHGIPRLVAHVHHPSLAKGNQQDKHEHDKRDDKDDGRQALAMVAAPTLDGIHQPITNVHSSPFQIRTLRT